MLKRKVASFGYAFNGFRIAFKEEVNFQIHLILAVIAVALGIYFGISTTEWLFIVTVIGIVLTAELLNTALEELCDMLRTTHDPHVAKIKDLAASAVLVSSVMALVVGVAIFLPRLLAI